MSVLSWLLRCLFVLPLIVTAILAGGRLRSGLASDLAFPVPLNISINHGLPISAYEAAERALDGADPADGEAKIERAEALKLSHASSEAVLPLLTDGLAREPASAGGWTLLAELPNAPLSMRAKALGLSLQLAPRDYWLSGRRALAGVPLVEVLSPDDKEALLRQIHLLWSVEDFRPQLHPLLESRQGAVLVTEAFAGDPDSLRALNRWVAQDRLRSVLQR